MQTHTTNKVNFQHTHKNQITNPIEKHAMKMHEKKIGACANTNSVQGVVTLDKRAHGRSALCN